MKNLLFLSILFLGLWLYPCCLVNGQGTSINNTGAPPDPSTILDVSSTSKGFALPRMTQVERDAIANPVEGLQIYNTTTKCLNIWIGTTWRQICGDCDFNSPVAGNNGPLCEGATLNLAATYIIGATYLWSGPNGFISTLQNPSIVNTTAAASGSYGVTATKNGCTSTLQTTVATVSAIPVTPVAGNDGPKCVGNVLNLTASTITGATYGWTGPNGYTASVQNPIISSAALTHTGTYSVTASVNGCISSAGTTSVTVNSLPATPGSISGASSLCSNSTGNVYSIAAVSGASSYNWTVFSGATITSNNGTSITISVGSNPSGNITVSATSACGTSALSSLAISTSSVCSPVTFSYTGSAQTFTVPGGVTSLTVDVKGAGGGGAGSPSQGGRVQALFSVTPGEVLNIYVGGQGGMNNAVNTPGGFNGGGSVPAGNYGPSFGSGGGASDIRRGGTALTDRIIVAGGGGGSEESTTRGGHGGGLIGGNGTSGCPGPGFGGTQSAGGAGGAQNGCGCNPYPGNAGSLGLGGNGVQNCCTPGCGSAYVTSGGGGGGYYGGGSGATYASGGGGSSYTLPSATGVVHTQGYQVGNGQITISW